MTDRRTNLAAEPSLTVADVARRYRISPEKVRGWVRRRELGAVNVAASLTGRAQLRITPEALAEFEGRRAAAPPPAPQRRRRQAGAVDYYPE